MLRIILKLSLFLFAVFILPALAHLGVWSTVDQPSGWRQANWSSAGILPPKPSIDEAAVYVLTARTGGIKGAFATHSWLVLKTPGIDHYDRYDVVGWGKPIRKNGYDADGHWYSNKPVINHHISGKKAERLLPQVEKAILNYRWQKRGDYTLWPGPNSNTFVARILELVPDLAASTPTTAVGRDFPVDGRWIGRRENGTWFASLGGYAGIAFGGNVGFELNFLGLVTGLNPATGEVFVPGFGGYKLF